MNTVEDSFTQGPGSSTDAKGQKVDPEDMAEGGTYTNDLQSLTVDNISPEVYAELPFLCANLTVVNNSDAEPLDISAFDWKMQNLQPDVLHHRGQAHLEHRTHRRVNEQPVTAVTDSMVSPGANSTSLRPPSMAKTPRSVTTMSTQPAPVSGSEHCSTNFGCPSTVQ